MTDFCKLCLVFHEELHSEQGSECLVEMITDVMNVARQKLSKMMWIYEKEIKRLEKACSE